MKGGLQVKSVNQRPQGLGTCHASRWARASIIAALLLAEVASAQTPGIRIIDPDPGYTHSQQKAISADGVTSVGYTYATAKPNHTYFWSEATGPQYVPDVPGAASSGVYDISNDGQFAAGYIEQFDGSVRAARYSRATSQYQVIDLPAGYARMVSFPKISGDGKTITATLQPIVERPAGQRNPFVWTQASGLRIIPHLYPTGFEQYVQAINNDGSVVVGSEDGRAWRWTPSGGTVRLQGLEPGFFVSDQAWAVSDDGRWVAGSSSFGAKAPMVRWDAAGVVQNLGILPGATYGDAFAISADGNTVAGSCIFSSSRAVASVWTPATGMISLSDLLLSYGVNVPAGWQLVQVNSVSADGKTFVGLASDPAFTIGRAFVATIPSPSAISGIAIASLGVFGRRSRGCTEATL